MRRLFLAILVAVVESSVSAAEYGHYDTSRLLIVSDTPAGKTFGFDGAYLEQMLDDLSVHAKNYPPKFDTPQDQQRATQDVKALSGMLDILLNGPTSSPPLLARAAYVNSMGHNLDVPGAAEKANAIFLRLLAATPSDPQGNYRYGTFLAGVGKGREALPYLEKALSVGVVDAAYAIGMTYLALGDQEQALKSLEDYKRRKSGDASVDKLIDAIRHGQVQFKTAR